MTKISAKSRTVLMSKAFTIGKEYGHSDATFHKSFQGVVTFLKGEWDATVRKEVEENIRLGIMQAFLSIKKGSEVSEEDTRKIRNLPTKDRTAAEQQCYEAANQRMSRFRKAYDIQKSDNRGRKQGTTNKPKTATTNPKAGSTLTPTVKGKEEYVKYMKGMAGYLQAFYEKNKDIADCDKEKTLILNYIAGCAILK